MICPFNPANLKSASYEMAIGGEVLYWDKEGKKQHFPDLSDGQEIIFLRNSITYVSVLAKFRLPNYIALRFNLQIEHVHRGLLLGTGPLINPGFNGRLMIPIHNLTDNDYRVKKGDPLIGVEFTKISDNVSWSNTDRPELARQGEYKENQKKKDDKGFFDYLNDYLPSGVGTVRSSLSSTLSAADNYVKKIQKWTTGIGFGAILVLLGLFAGTWNLISDANKYVADSTKSFRQENERVVSEFENNFSKLKATIEVLRKNIEDTIKSFDVKIEDTHAAVNKEREDDLKRLQQLLETIDTRITRIEDQMKKTK